jgi:hypothetical protein
MDNAVRVGGALLVLAGLYQLSPLKRVCLTECRSPLSFILSSWRDGRGGAFRMGLEHGIYCLGCCWLCPADFSWCSRSLCRARRRWPSAPNAAAQVSKLQSATVTTSRLCFAYRY